jgi:hypothetical protein
MRTCAVLTLLALMSARAGAQEQTVPRIEAGPDVAGFQIPFSTIKSGGGGHVAIAITPWLSVETRVRLFGENSPPLLNDGGKTLQVFAGARAAFLSRGRWTLYGVLLPGIVHFTNAVTDVCGATVTTGGSSHFALDMGAGVGVRLSRRWDAHVEWTGPLYTVRGLKDPPDPPPGTAGAFLQVVVPPRVESTAQISAGVSYRAGSLHGTTASPRRGSWLAGGEIGSATYAPFVTISTDVTHATRVGGFTSIPITAWMDADAGANVYLRYDRGYATIEGGRIAQALGGVKLGRRAGRIGYFAKIRVGTQTHSDALPEGKAFRPENFRRTWRPALEIGTVIETTIHRRLVWRFDAAAVAVFYPSAYREPAGQTIALTSGLAWRFNPR